MEITLLYFEGCPSWKVAEERLAVLTAERSDLTVTRRAVESVEDAERLGFYGSPSLLLEGVDLFAQASAGVGLACRIYQTPEGPSGAPTLDQMRAAISGA